MESDKFSTIQETNLVDKTTTSLTLYEETMMEHIKANIVYQCVKEASLGHEDNLPGSTASKLKTLLLTHRLDEYTRVLSTSRHTQDEMKLLGINHSLLSDLNPDERLEVRCCVETMLREKTHDMISRYETLGGDIKKMPKGDNLCKKFLDCHSIKVAKRKNKIEELAAEYESLLLRYKDLMNRWNDLKYEDTSQAYLMKSEHLLLQMQVAELQAKVTKISCMMKMFKETPITVDAFGALNTVIEKELRATLEAIHQKEESKKLYDNLKSTEYDEVLKAYLQFCKVVEKKKQILNMLK